MRAISFSFVAALALAAAACALDDSPTAPADRAGLVEAAAPAGRPLSAELTGDAEVPGPGDPDGTGSASVTLNAGLETVCWTVTWEDIAAPTAAHIHRGTADVAGPPVIPLSPLAEGCATASRDLLREILVDPDAFYVNVHNAQFPAGAIRGQLSK